MFLSACLDLLPEESGAPGFAHYSSRAKAAEDAGLDVLILGRETAGGIAPGRLEALVTMPWIAGVARRAAVVGVLPALHSVPFHVARALSAIDFLSDGRTGWMPAVPGGDRFDHAYGPAYTLPAGETVAKYDDFIRATQALWDSWDDDALVLDKDRGEYLDSTKVRRVAYEGPYFSTMGPLNAARPPQGHPLLFREGISAATTPADVRLAAADETASGAVFVKTDLAGLTGTLKGEPSALGIHLTGNPSAADIAAARAIMPAASAVSGTLRDRLGLARPINPFTKAAL